MAACNSEVLYEDDANEKSDTDSDFEEFSENFQFLVIYLF